MSLHWRAAAWCSVVVFLPLVAACHSSGPVPDAAASNVAAATKETEDWRAQHEKSYRENWATIAGLHFLEAGSHRPARIGGLSTNRAIRARRRRRTL
jgi:hypothetical protein